MNLEIIHPAYLWGLILPALLVGLILMRRSMRPRNRAGVASFLLRLAIMALVLLGLSRVVWIRDADEQALIFLVDVSRSVEGSAGIAADRIQEIREQAGAERESLVVFAGDARVIPLEEIDGSGELAAAIAEVADELERGQTNLSTALQIGAGLFPEGYQRRLLLFSDGNATVGKETSPFSPSSHLRLDVYSLRRADTAEALIAAASVPESLRVGESFTLRAELESTVETGARLNLYLDQFLVSTQEVTLSPGRNEVEFPDLEAGSGFSIYELELIAEADTLMENNRFQVPVNLEGQLRVLILDDDELLISRFADGLRKNQFEVEVRSPAGAPRGLEELQRYDVVILSNVPVLTFTPQQQSVYRKWVSELGGTFIMAGGEESFGAGGWHGSEVGRMLPVEIEHEDRERSPSVALLVVLDRSGSMAATVQGQTKLSLAAQGASLALDVLADRDYFGLMAVDTEVYPVVSLARQPDREGVREKLMSVSPAGGGIYVYTALSEAFESLQKVEAKIKHVILFSDASDAEEKVMDRPGGGGESALELVSAMVGSQVTTSVVALGFESDQDTPFLQAVAARGNGRFYLTSNALNLPQIFTAEAVKVATSSLAEGAFLVSPATTESAVSGGILDGIDWALAPPVLGYNLTRLRQGADLLLASDTGDPVLAKWRLGLGQVVAFTVDLRPRWSAEWMEWPGFDQLWAQLLRATSRRTEQGQVEMSYSQKDGLLEVTIDAVTLDGSFQNELELTLAGVKKDGTTVTQRARQIGPGRYAATLEAHEDELALLAASAPEYLQRPVSIPVGRGYPAEFSATAVNEDVLQEIARAGRGKVDAPTEDLLKDNDSLEPVIQRAELTDLFFILAILLLPLEVLFRRISAA